MIEARTREGTSRQRQRRHHSAQALKERPVVDKIVRPVIRCYNCNEIFRGNWQQPKCPKCGRRPLGLSLPLRLLCTVVPPAAVVCFSTSIRRSPRAALHSAIHGVAGLVLWAFLWSPLYSLWTNRGA